jgi:hypothetical protein
VSPRSSPASRSKEPGSIARGNGKRGYAAARSSVLAISRKPKSYASRPCPVGGIFRQSSTAYGPAIGWLGFPEGVSLPVCRLFERTGWRSGRLRSRVRPLKPKSLQIVTTAWPDGCGSTGPTLRLVAPKAPQASGSTCLLLKVGCRSLCWLRSSAGSGRSNHRSPHVDRSWPRVRLAPIRQVQMRLTGRFGRLQASARGTTASCA